MKNFRYLVNIIVLTAFSVGILGCYTPKDEFEKVRSELDETKSKLLESLSELEKTTIALKEARNAYKLTKTALREAELKVVEQSKAISERDNAIKSAKERLRISLDRHEKEKKMLMSKVAAAHHEAIFLKEKLDELLHGLSKVSGERDITKGANEALQAEVDRLTLENVRLQALNSN